MSFLVLGPDPALAVRGHVFEKTFGSEGASNGELKDPLGVAVNEATKDVYVADEGNDRVERFSSTGTYIGKFDGSGSYEVEGKVEADEAAPTGQFSHPEGIAVDNSMNSEDPSAGDVYVVDDAHSVIDKFSASGAYVGQLTVSVEKPNELYGVAVGTDGELWVYRGPFEQVARFTDAQVNEAIEEISIGFLAGFPALGFAGFAVDSNDDLYLEHNMVVAKAKSDGTVLTDEVGSEGGTAIAVERTSNDVYIEDGESVARFSSAGALLEHVGAGHLIHGSGVAVNSSTNAVYAVDTAADKVDAFSLEPSSSPAIESESVSEVTDDSVNFSAEINPRSLSGEEGTKYHFEYGPCATVSMCANSGYEANVPMPDSSLGADFEVHDVTELVQKLKPDTAYHYRVVASNGLGIVDGSDHDFTTQSIGTSLRLLDGRAWELVSPPNKHGATIQSFDASGAVTQASEGGGVISYAASAATEANPPGSVGPERVQVLSERAPDGWKSRDIVTPHDVPTAENQTGHESEYKFFSDDLSLGIVEPVGETPLSSEALEQTPYRRDDASNVYLPLITAANAPSVKFANRVKFVDATPDLSHIVVQSSVSLTSPSSGAGLYEWSGGRLQPVSVLSNREPAPSPLLGDRGFSQGGVVRHAISSDGSRVVWEAESHLYLRDMTREETVQLDTVESGAQGGIGTPRFQTASSDGSKVFFTDSKQLTVDSNGDADLYEFEVTGSGIAGKLNDLTVDRNVGEHGAVRGEVLGASEDGAYVYLVDNGVLTDIENGEKEEAVQGRDNLYVLHNNGTEWTISFVARLSNEDLNDWEAGVGHNEYLSNLTSRVSPNGRWLAFMSNKRLTGYDNRDAGSGEPDEEVFLYGADSGRLVCASCNPSGARPMGMFDSGEVPQPLVDFPEVWGGRWLAALIPGWTPVDLHHSLYQSRYLSDGGRLFFDSADALVSQDTNRKEDVYEYEPMGEGSCRPEAGCVGLISSGGSGEESMFLDASVSGNDVFFLTTARLAPQDNDASLDVYDAHVCSTAVPCPASPPALPPACTNSDSCRAAPSLQPPIFGPSASATFSGAGNIVQPQPKVKPKQVKCKRGLVRKKVTGKTRCVKSKRKAHGVRHAKKSTRGRKA